MIKKTKEFFEKSPKFLPVLLIFLIYGIAGTVFFSYFYLQNWNTSIYTINFEFGDLLENLVKKGEYRSAFKKELFHTELPITYASHRLPLVPYFLASTIFLTGIETIGKIMLIKNLIFMALMAISFYFTTTEKQIKAVYKWLLLAFMLSFPQLAFYGLGIEFEESYGIPAFALLWGLVTFSGKPTRNFKILFVFATVLLFFVKNTSLYICPLIPILYYILYRDKKVVAITYALLLISVLGLSEMNYKNSGKFTPKYSFEGWNFYKGNCERTMDYYPLYNIDYIDLVNPVILPKETVKKEWDNDVFYKKLAFEYVSTHKFETFKRLFVKAFTVFVEIRPNAIWLNENRFDSPVKYVGAFFMLIFRLLEFATIFAAIFSIRKHRKNKRLLTFSVAYLLFVAAFCGPYVLAYGYERHILPIIIPVIYSAFYYFNEFFPKFQRRRSDDFSSSDR